MPKRKDDTPENLRPFIFHGLDLTWKDGDKEALGNCPWCSADNKFSVNIETSQWRCFACAEGPDGKAGGNSASFLSMLWSKSYDATTTKQYKELSENRLVDWLTLQQWHVAKSIITGEWLVPGYSASNKLYNLYRYAKLRDGTKLLGTTGCAAQMFGMNLFSDSKETAFICEGPWDGMCLWETLAGVKDKDDGYTVTANQSASLLADINVVGVPGCTTFQESWVSLFKDMNVVICFDNDPPITNKKTKKKSEPAAYTGTKRLAGLLTGTAQSISYINWRDVT